MTLIKTFLKQNRSYRRFDESIKIPNELIKEWVANLRFTNATRNVQPLKYRIVTDTEECKAIFPLLRWAAFYQDWNGPSEGERPTSYVVQLLDTTISNSPRFDEGLHIAALGLQSTEAGFACCTIAAFNTDRLTEILSIPAHLKPNVVIAIGKPAEKIVIEDLKGEDTKYYRTEDGIHHVPKRLPEDIII